MTPPPNKLVYVLILTAMTLPLLYSGLQPRPDRAQPAPFTLRETELAIPQVDYEPAIYHKAGDPLPYLDLKKVSWRKVIKKTHRAIVMENKFTRLTLLPESGRVYSMVYLPTGHEIFWHNDIVRPGAANNETGWWLWFGGLEYTLPGDEHGTTWALPWKYEVLEDGPSRKAVRMEVAEPTSGLRERIDVSVYPGTAGFESDIRIWNPGPRAASFAHWMNPMWAPGGTNEVTDNTELIIPTERIVIEKRWQKNLGPSPQPWLGNPLRFLRNWKKMGDIQADGLTAGFFGVYSHDAEEGVARVFDPLASPGVDTWTYGFHPKSIPMGSGAPSKGYIEMWGGTVKTFPDERQSLAPGASLAWTEWMYPFERTHGMSCATRFAAVNFTLSENHRRVKFAICPVGKLNRAVAEVRSAGRVVERLPFRASPDQPYRVAFDLNTAADPAELLLRVSEDGVELLRCRPEMTGP